MESLEVDEGQNRAVGQYRWRRNRRPRRPQCRPHCCPRCCRQCCGQFQRYPARTTTVPDFAHVSFTAEIPPPNQGFPARFLGPAPAAAIPSFTGLAPAINAAQPNCHPRCPTFTPKVPRRDLKSLHQHIYNTAAKRGWYAFPGELHNEINLVLPDRDIDDLRLLQENPAAWVDKQQKTTPASPAGHDPSELINAIIRMGANGQNTDPIFNASVFAICTLISLIVTAASFVASKKRDTHRQQGKMRPEQAEQTH